MKRKLVNFSMTQITISDIEALPELIDETPAQTVLKLLDKLEELGFTQEEIRSILLTNLIAVE